VPVKANQARVKTSAVVEGERSGTPFHQIFCGWNTNIVGVSRNGGAVAFPQNAMSQQ